MTASKIDYNWSVMKITLYSWKKVHLKKNHTKLFILKKKHFDFFIIVSSQRYLNYKIRFNYITFPIPISNLRKGLKAEFRNTLKPWRGR